MSAPPPLLDAVLDGRVAEYALICRGGQRARTVELVTGTVTHPGSLDAIDRVRRPTAGPGRGAGGAAGSDVLVVVPYRQLAERGYPAPDDDTPLIAMAVTGEERYPVAEVLGRLPHRAVRLTRGRFDPGDEEYARTVRAVLDDEIGTGQGANFVIRRTYLAEVTDHGPDVALSVFRELLANERGAYWTFLVVTRDVTLVGASPERHLGLTGEVATMNPISGTYPYPAGGPTLEGVTRFLADRKEVEELYMVVDEELKMMCRICRPGTVRVEGPYLKEMARVAHTEYHITGRTGRDVPSVLRETMFAPTVTGSPVESAARVIQRYEPAGRRYYSGVIGLVGTDAAGARTLDSAILIRTAELEPSGRLTIAVGATLVRHSDPMAEVAETRAKAMALLEAFGEPRDGRGLATAPEVRDALRRRNDGIADFWLASPAAHAVTAHAAVIPEAAVTAHAAGTRRPPRPLAGHRALVIDAEDAFTSMLDHQLRALGLAVTVRRFDEPYRIDDHDLVVAGPGPGDPCDAGNPKIAILEKTLGELLARRRPFLAVCLSHQVLCRRLGLPLARRERPNQGVQRRVRLFGSAERVGFYNTFEARSTTDRWESRETDGIGPVEVSRDPATGEVHALRHPWFASLQFHAESLLTVDGPRILTHTIEGVLSP